MLKILENQQEAIISTWDDRSFIFFHVYSCFVLLFIPKNLKNKLAKEEI